MNRIFNSINNQRKIILISLLFMFVFSLNFALDPDMYWHIKSGEWILQNGIPQQDTFSYWGGNFLAHEWLFDIILFPIYSAVGYVGLQLILFLTLGLTAYTSFYLAEKEQKSNLILYLIPFILLYPFAGIIVPRPHMISTLAIMLEIYILEKEKTKLMWTLPLFTLLMANMHGGSVFIFIVILAVYLADYIFSNIPNLNKKTVVRYLVLLAIMSVTTIITPYGMDCVLYGSKISQEVLQYIYEWHPIIQSSGDIPYLFLMILPLACMAYTKDAKLKDILMLCMGMMLTFIWLRMIIIYVFIYAIYGTKYIHNTIKDILQKLNLPAINFKIKFPIAHVFIGVLIVLFGFNISNISLEKMEKNSVIAPEIITNYIKENNIDIVNNVMFNHYNFGGYFVYHHPKVFIDGRADVYMKEFGSPDVFPDYNDILNLEPNAEELIKEYNIKYFAVYKGYDFYNYLLENGATELISDEQYALLEYK